MYCLLCYTSCIGFLCIVLSIKASESDIFVSLEKHLRRKELSQKRNIFYQSNLEETREYVLDYWRSLCNLDSARTGCADIEIITYYLEHTFAYDSMWDYVPYEVDNPQDMFPMEYEGENLILVVKGQHWGSCRDRPVVIGAHYDTYGNSSGVNDNGAGIAAMLEMSRLIVNNGEPRKHSVIFVAFDLEEYGAIGSDHFLFGWLLPEVLQKYCIPIENFQGGIILDTVMNYNTTANSQNMSFTSETFDDTLAYLERNDYRGDFISVIGREDETDLLQVITTSWEDTHNKPTQMHMWKLPFTGRPDAGLHDDYFTLMRSDHARFWEYHDMNGTPSLKAVFVTDTAPYRGDMQECYHTLCDDATSITDDKIRFLERLTRSLAHSVQELATHSKDDESCSLDHCHFLTSKVGKFHSWKLAIILPLILFSI